MSAIGKITMQSDENGLVTLQCDRCRSRFKMDCQYLTHELKGDICCPVCGISESLNTFLPKEAVEEGLKVAQMQAEQMIADALKGLNSKYIKVKTKPIKSRNRDIVLKDKDSDMTVVTVHCCHKDIALKPADFTAGFYCPYCGRIVK